MGSTWTLELRTLDRATTLGRVVDWISSGVPVCQPEPDTALACELLAARGLPLIRESSAGFGTRSRRRIGYVRADTELVPPAAKPTSNGSGTHRGRED
ncbi:MAG: hypothetical protein JO287_03660 [Pseudonocardiales bacterium]|nr:hypothetical protein [Pseudonocardiales bacterium]